jgi:hypothetical protein
VALKLLANQKGTKHYTYGIGQLNPLRPITRQNGKKRGEWRGKAKDVNVIYQQMEKTQK